MEGKWCACLLGNANSCDDEGVLRGICSALYLLWHLGEFPNLVSSPRASVGKTFCHSLFLNPFGSGRSKCEEMKAVKQTSAPRKLNRLAGTPAARCVSGSRLATPLATPIPSVHVWREQRTGQRSRPSAPDWQIHDYVYCYDEKRKRTLQNVIKFNSAFTPIHWAYNKSG